MKLRSSLSGNFKAVILATRVDTFNRSSVVNLLNIDDRSYWNIKVIV